MSTTTIRVHGRDNIRKAGVGRFFTSFISKLFNWNFPGSDKDLEFNFYILPKAAFQELFPGENLDDLYLSVELMMRSPGGASVKYRDVIYVEYLQSTQEIRVFAQCENNPLDRRMEFKGAKADAVEAAFKELRSSFEMHLAAEAA
jgi:hypothetical protein